MNITDLVRALLWILVLAFWMLVAGFATAIAAFFVHQWLAMLAGLATFYSGITLSIKLFDSFYRRK